MPILFSFDTCAFASERGALALRSVHRAIGRLGGSAPWTVTFIRPQGVLVFYDAAQKAPATQFASDVLAELSRLAGETALGAGVGPACSSLAQYASAYRQAHMAGRLARRLRSARPLDAARLGVYQLLLGISEESTLHEFVAANLGPLLAHDAANGAELVKTLEAYHAASERLRPAATALFVHVNTLKYRIGRIEALTRCSLDDSSARLNLYLALYALQLLEPGRNSMLPDEGRAPGLSPANEAR